MGPDPPKSEDESAPPPPYTAAQSRPPSFVSQAPSSRPPSFVSQASRDDHADDTIEPLNLSSLFELRSPASSTFDRSGRTRGHVSGGKEVLRPETIPESEHEDDEEAHSAALWHNLPFERHTEDSLPPYWLRINMKVATYTASLMILIAIVNGAFSGVMREDLGSDTHGDFECEYHYIADANEPYEGNSYLDPGRYHSQCRQLYSWTILMVVAVVLSIVRIFVEVVPVSLNERWSFKTVKNRRCCSGNTALLIRAGFSAAPAGLYVAAAIMLAASRLISGPKARDSYKDMYTVCLGLVVCSAVLSLHQVAIHLVAAYMLRKRNAGSRM